MWIGSQGWELIAVPEGNPGGPEGFTFIARPYVEVVSFTPIGAPVPNRGGPVGEMFITGLMYDMRITDLVTNEPLHLKTGPRSWPAYTDARLRDIPSPCAANV